MTASAAYIFTYFDYWKPDGETHGQPAFTKTCWHSDFGQRKNAMDDIGLQLIPF